MASGLGQQRPTRGEAVVDDAAARRGTGGSRGAGDHFGRDGPSRAAPDGPLGRAQPAQASPGGRWPTYLTDLTDAEYAWIEPYRPGPRPTGRPREHSYREILDAIFYLVRSGCAWRLLPHEFPPWQTIYHYFRLWRLDGTWERLHTVLREQLRTATGRNPQPSAAILDSQSARTNVVGGVRGYVA